MTELKVFQKQNLDPSRKFMEASGIAQKLLVALNEASTINLLLEANKPKASSSLIQNCFLPVATSLGFRNEARGLFENYANKHLRPDYYLDLKDGCGILLEVERSLGGNAKASLPSPLYEY